MKTRACAALELGGVVEQIGAELEILRDRHRREDAAPFRHQHHAARDAGVGRLARQRRAAKADVAGIGDETHDGAHQRALARAIGAQHGHELAVRNRQADVVQRLDAPVARRELPDLENRRHFTTMTRPPMMLASRNGLTVMP